MKILRNCFLISLLSLVLTSCFSFWQYQEKKDKDGNIIPTQLKRSYKDMSKNSFYNYDYSNSNGENKVLVIPVWFTDSETYININNKETVRTDIEKAYFGTVEETGWNSVKSYYETESLGRLDYQGTVSEWYECGKESTFFYDTARGYMGTMGLVSEATDWYFNTHTNENRRDYDKDHNGYLDGVLIIYASPNSTSLGIDEDNMWAYCYWLSDARNKNVNNPGPNAFFWASYDFMYNSTTALERTGKTNYGGGDSSHCIVDAHTYIHEMGHVFGLDDYYDYGSKRYNPAGAFSMQDHNVGGHDPFSAMALGWTDPIIPTTSQSIIIRPYVTSHDVILLTPSWNKIDSPFDEYLLVELYTPTGLNELDSLYNYNGDRKGPSDVGIRLWHVDARLVYSNSVKEERGRYYPAVSESKMTVDPLYKCKYGVQHAFSNTYDGSYMGPLGKEYAYYNLLQYVRNSSTDTFRPSSHQSNDNLFEDNDAFNIVNVKKQFVKATKLNIGKELGWTFKVKINGEGDNLTATITLTRV